MKFLMKLHVHNYTKVIYIQYQFHEISFISYLVIAEVRQKDRGKDGPTDVKPISLRLSQGDKNW